jgi:hypothetical protein
MDETKIKIDEFRFRFEQTPELIPLACVDDCINIAYITKEFIFPANDAGKLPPDTVAKMFIPVHSLEDNSRTRTVSVPVLVDVSSKYDISFAKSLAIQSPLLKPHSKYAILSLRKNWSSSIDHE